MNVKILCVGKIKEKFYREAISDFTKAIELGTSLQATFTNRGGCYYMLGDYDSAIRDFNQNYKPTLEGLQAAILAKSGRK